MDLGNVSDKAKDLLDGRGGIDSLKEDLSEVSDVVQGDGSLADKASSAFAAVKDPGAPGASAADAPVADAPAAE